MARAKPYKWIANEIERLDPVADYDRIWKLSSVYYVNDFSMDFVYAVTFPYFLITDWGAEAVLRHGEGKMYSDPDRRMDDTARHMLVWWENGPEDLRTQRSVKSLNNLHAYYAKQFPGNFKYNDDYIYTLCYEGAMMHRLRLRLGMKGFTEKQQRSSWEFWSRMAKLFRNGETGEELTGFPEDFAAMNEFMDAYEGRDWPRNQYGAEVERQILEPFAKRRFPKLLHPVARAVVTSMYPDPVIDAHGMKRPSRWVVRTSKLAVRAALTLSEKVLPDPVESLPEIHRRRKSEKSAANQPAQCPHPAGQAAQSASRVEPREVTEAREANAFG